jgi:glycerol kinase
VWSSTDELRETWSADREFTPTASREAADASYARWKDAVERSRGWAQG